MKVDHNNQPKIFIQNKMNEIPPGITIPGGISFISFIELAERVWEIIGSNRWSSQTNDL